MQKYDVIGKSYNLTRKADNRITKKIINLLRLEAGTSIADIGAGTGNYTFELAELGYKIIAIEPSDIMRKQGKQHSNIKWVEGFAESLPIQDKAVHGLISTLATHHFTSLGRSFSEIKRVLKEKGSLVIFTNDPRLCPQDFWMNEYFKEIIINAYKIHPPIHEFCGLLEAETGKKSTIHEFPLPFDLEDGFFCSAWRYPERYLNKKFCEGISVLAQLNKETLTKYLDKLETDLINGKWETQYGQIRNQVEYDCGYRFITFEDNVM